MNMEQLQTEWKRYSRKLEVSRQLNDELIISMLRERSRSRISAIRKNNMVYLGLMMLNLVLLAGIFLGNPFDFGYTLQFVPYAILAIGVLMAVASLIKSLQQFNVNLNKVDLDSFLKTTILEYEKSRKMNKWFGILIFSAGLLTVFSFLPKKLENKDLWPALGETALMAVITCAIYFIAFKLGAFKDRKKEGFENDHKELQQLKAISAELGGGAIVNSQ